MLGCMKGKFEQDRVSVASLTICLVQDEPQLLLERGLTAVAHLVQLFPPTDSVPVSAVSQSNMTTLLNDGCSQTQTRLSGPQRHHCSSFLLIPHTHFCCAEAQTRMHQNELWASGNRKIVMLQGLSWMFVSLLGIRE